jgi:Uma2 family endonuclease
MPTATQVSLDEYMHTTYRPDREYVDGELLERNVGKNDHARIQALLASWFVSQEPAWNTAAYTEMRVQVSPTRVRIPDVLLVPLKPHPEVLVEPPILVVEILSPDDSYTDTQRRSADYLQMGVRAVWIIDPATRTGRCCVGNSWTAASRLEVPDTPIWVELPALFDRMSETSMA